MDQNILGVIADFYGQINALQQENASLREALAQRDAVVEREVLRAERREEEAFMTAHEPTVPKPGPRPPVTN